MPIIEITCIKSPLIRKLASELDNSTNKDGYITNEYNEYNRLKEKVQGELLSKNKISQEEYNQVFSLNARRKQTGYSSRLTKKPIDERIIQSNNKVQSNNKEYVMTDLKVAVKNELNSAPKQQNGSISRKDAIKVLQNIFKQNNGTKSAHSKEASTSKTVHKDFSHINREARSTGDILSTSAAGYGYGFGYGYGGFLSQTKDLFELYMDQDSEGGTSITKNEQQEIIKTINAWF